jgi:hypothetical protein
VACAFAAASAAAQVGPPAPGAIAFVIAGQSNALGEAPLEAGDDQPVPAVQVLRRDGFVYDSAEPIGGAGYGFGRAFAQAFLAQHTAVPEVWIVQCAVTGTPISAWQPGFEPYDGCSTLIHEAQGMGLPIRAVLWHQGEANARSKPLAWNYGRALRSLIENLREEIGGFVPFVAGELGRFLPQEDYPVRSSIVGQTSRATMRRCGTAFVLSKGLTDKGDDVHFDHASYDELGRRYAAALAAIERIRIPCRP